MTRGLQDCPGCLRSADSTQSTERCSQCSKLMGCFVFSEAELKASLEIWTHGRTKEENSSHLKLLGIFFKVVFKNLVEKTSFCFLCSTSITLSRSTALFFSANIWCLYYPLLNANWLFTVWSDVLHVCLIVMRQEVRGNDTEIWDSGQVDHQALLCCMVAAGWGYLISLWCNSPRFCLFSEADSCNLIR